MRQGLEFLVRHRWLPALVCASAILSVSSIPKLDVAVPPFPGCDKVAHLIEYFILGVGLRFWADSRRALGSWPWVVLAGVVLGAADEVHQSFIPGRVMSLGDFVADAAGVGLGFAFGHRLILKRLFGGTREE